MWNKDKNISKMEKNKDFPPSGLCWLRDGTQYVSYCVVLYFIDLFRKQNGYTYMRINAKETEYTYKT